MDYLINIDTHAAIARISLSGDGQVISRLESTGERNHAAFLPGGIHRLMQESAMQATRLSAVAISAGPGSYTGLRIGSSTAKGLCYAWNLPLIAISSLKVLGREMITGESHPDWMYCPMMDARRAEVYTAVYDAALNEIIHPGPMILAADSFSTLLASHTVCFSGDGAQKGQILFNPSSRAVFRQTPIGPDSLAQLAWEEFRKGLFQNLAYFEPFYLKAFHRP